MNLILSIDQKITFFDQFWFKTIKKPSK